MHPAMFWLGPKPTEPIYLYIIARTRSHVVTPLRVLNRKSYLTSLWNRKILLYYMSIRTLYRLKDSVSMKNESTCGSAYYFLSYIISVLLSILLIIFCLVVEAYVLRKYIWIKAIYLKITEIYYMIY